MLRKSPYIDQNYGYLITLMENLDILENPMEFENSKPSYQANELTMTFSLKGTDINSKKIVNNNCSTFGFESLINPQFTILL